MVTNMWPSEVSPAYGIFVYRQVESLRDLGVRCRVVFVRGHESRWSYLFQGLRLLALNLFPGRPALVHAHGGETALVARCFVRSPVIVSYCGDDLLGTPRADGSLTFVSRVRRTVLRQHARTLRASITKSQEMERALPKSIQARNHVVPNGVDRRLFKPTPRADARRALGWDDEEAIILFAADPAVERKRHWLADAARKQAERQFGPIRMEVAWGTPPNQMPRLMAACDCLLLTSAIEGSPNVVKEAVACELPVVSTRVGDVAKLLSGVEPSWICPDQPDALAMALIDCLRRGIRSNGYEHSAWLGQEAVAERLRQIYFELAPSLSSAGPMH